MRAVKVEVKDALRDGKVYAIITDDEKFNKIPVGELLDIKIDYYRNLKHHRKLFAVLNEAVKHIEGATTDSLLITCKYELGLIDEVETMSGKVVIVPKSIAFDKMGQNEFETKVYGPILKLLSTYLGVTVEELEKNSKEGQ